MTLFNSLVDLTRDGMLFGIGTARAFLPTNGKFERTLQVPKGLDRDAVTVSTADGVLTIHVPLPKARKPRRIEIAKDNQAAIERNINWDDLEAGTSENSHTEAAALAGAAP